MNVKKNCIWQRIKMSLKKMAWEIIIKKVTNEKIESCKKKKTFKSTNHENKNKHYLFLSN